MDELTAAHPLAGNLPLDNISLSVFKDSHVFRPMMHQSPPLEVRDQVTMLLLSRSASSPIDDGLSQGLEQPPAGGQAATRDSTRDRR